MLRHRIYYQIKPFMPRVVRMAVRGWVARRKRAYVRDVWPVARGSERAPRNWPGWPDGKQFALVLTHDVESQAGLDQVVPLAELEMKHGLRSSFNFIPEGPYTVPDRLRAWLTERGFEVAIHDLRHDGRLYETRQAFSENTRQINAYLRKWNAVGFRSGFMLHNLEWLSDLNVAYDMSTFDTDPFEPQPDGVHTIFPFFVPRDEERKDQSQVPGQKSQVNGAASPGLSTFDLGPSTGAPAARPSTFDHQPSTARAGYVELPYTLAQDSTLFLLLREPSIGIWTQKLDWIAKHGGMALMNVHPDYMDFSGRGSGSRYDVRLYEAFLKHVQQRHPRLYWAARPKEVAQHVRKFQSYRRELKSSGGVAVG